MDPLTLIYIKAMLKKQALDGPIINTEEGTQLEQILFLINSLILHYKNFGDN